MDVESSNTSLPANWKERGRYIGRYLSILFAHSFIFESDVFSAVDQLPTFLTFCFDLLSENDQEFVNSLITNKPDSPLRRIFSPKHVLNRRTTPKHARNLRHLSRRRREHSFQHQIHNQMSRLPPQVQRRDQTTRKGRIRKRNSLLSAEHELHRQAVLPAEQQPTDNGIGLHLPRLPLDVLLGRQSGRHAVREQTDPK